MGGHNFNAHISQVVKNWRYKFCTASDTTFINIANGRADLIIPIMFTRVYSFFINNIDFVNENIGCSVQVLLSLLLKQHVE